MSKTDLSPVIKEFQTTYNSEKIDQVWKRQSAQFRDFWTNKVLNGHTDVIPDAECDKIIRILDRNGKGNTKDSEAVARAMVPQGAWRRMFNEFHANQDLASLITKILEETIPDRKASLIDELYKKNEGKGNNLTGPSGNTINAFLAAYDPFNNISIISLNDRRTYIEFLELAVSFNWEKDRIGHRIVATNKILLDGIHALGITGSARTVSRFCYFSPMKALWKGQHTVKRPDKSIAVTVPSAADAEDIEESEKGDLRESMQMQALIAKIGTSMGFTIWLPKSDRGRVLTAWKPKEKVLLEDLPLGYDPTTLKTIEQIDVIWLKKRTIVRAFEVEHTTSVYSGLLRMADLVALQPNINIKLHIVAPAFKRDKVFQEIQRPVFSLLEGRALAELCTFLSYDSIKAIGDSPHLEHLSDAVIGDYEEKAEADDA